MAPPGSAPGGPLPAPAMSVSFESINSNLTRSLYRHTLKCGGKYRFAPVLKMRKLRGRPTCLLDACVNMVHECKHYINITPILLYNFQWGCPHHFSWCNYLSHCGETTNLIDIKVMHNVKSNCGLEEMSV